MKRLAKSFEASSCAAARVGPKIAQPRLAERVDHAGGERRLRPDHGQLDLFASWRRRSSSGNRRKRNVLHARLGAVPPLPGATNTFCTRGPCASFHASACSRPPEPMTRSFISVPEVAHAGEHHGDAALVGRARSPPRRARCRRAGSPRRRRRRRRTSSPSRNGKKASEATTEPASVELRAPRLDGGDARAVDAAHLPGADAERHAVAAEHDGVGLDELRHAPGEEQVGPLRIRRLALRDDTKIFACPMDFVSLLCTSSPPPTRL